jgi:hypothetical protein
MPLFTKIVLALVTSAILVASFAAADCAIYNNANKDNRDNYWYGESKMTPDEGTKTFRHKDHYNGVMYSFYFEAGTRAKDGLKSIDTMKIKRDGKGRRVQFKTKVKDSKGAVLRSYWSAAGADCIQDTPWKDVNVAEVVISERCYRGCSDIVENP